MNTYREAAGLLPLNLCSELLIMPENIKNNAEEIRLRAGKHLTVLADGRENIAAKDYVLSSEDLYSVLEKATFASLHSVESELARGYITVGSGIRIGVCGSAVYKSGKLCGIKDFSSLSIRIPRDFKGCSSELCREINADGLKSVLIISPPGYGKTTFLRDYIRCLSYGGTRVSVADERCELGTAHDGLSTYDLGACTDMMSGVLKSEAAMMLLRSMNPEIIAMDEISEPKDVKAAAAVYGCGVKLVATAHAAGVEDLIRRAVYRELLNMNIFDCAVIIKRENNLRKYIIEVLRT